MIHLSVKSALRPCGFTEAVRTQFAAEPVLRPLAIAITNSNRSMSALLIGDHLISNGAGATLK